MEREIPSQAEIDCIQERLEYLQQTDQISISDKIAIIKKALEIIQQG